eukprot:4253140-Amphidinium_carterae.1
MMAIIVCMDLLGDGAKPCLACAHPCICNILLIMFGQSNVHQCMNVHWRQRMGRLGIIHRLPTACLRERARCAGSRRLL